MHNLSTQIKVSSPSRIGEGDNINIMLEGSNIERNEAIINELIEISHDKQIFDKQEIFSLSIDFINRRLISIKNEIDSLTLRND